MWGSSRELPKRLCPTITRETQKQFLVLQFGPAIPRDCCHLGNESANKRSLSPSLQPSLYFFLELIYKNGLFENMRNLKFMYVKRLTLIQIGSLSRVTIKWNVLCIQCVLRFCSLCLYNMGVTGCEFLYNQDITHILNKWKITSSQATVS